MTGNTAAFSQGRQKVLLTELLTIGDETGAVIYQWVDLVTDPQGNIYLTDLKDFRLKKFDPQGAFIAKTGARGQGPGEFQSPGKIRYFNGCLFVAEIQNPGIQIFDTDLNYQRRVPVNLPVTDFQVLDKTTIAAATLNSKNLLMFDHNGNQVKSLAYAFNSSFMLNSVSFFYGEDAFYLSYKWQDIICKISRHGQLIWSKHPFGGKKSPLKKIGNIKVPHQIAYKTICGDNRGRIYVLGGDWAAQPSRNIYVLSSQGRLIGEITLPEATHTFHIDRENQLYTRSAYGTLVKKYRIEPRE